jgi:hypothetical protein
VARGTAGSNPVCSSGELAINLGECVAAQLCCRAPAGRARRVVTRLAGVVTHLVVNLTARAFRAPGTIGSNPSPSSGESVSPVDNGAAREKSRAFAGPRTWVET